MRFAKDLSVIQSGLKVHRQNDVEVTKVADRL